MAFVVTEPCYDCKYTDCVCVCPTEGFYQDESMLYIHPDECIDCEGCVPECPVEAIFAEAEVPRAWLHYIELNRERTAARVGHITEKQDPKPGAGCKKRV